MVTYYGELGIGSARPGTSYVLAGDGKHGAEGTVYEIAGKPGYVAKIYSQSHFDEVANRREGRSDGREFMHEKLKAMVAMRGAVASQRWASLGGHLFVAWPMDILLDADGAFSGYVMHRVKGGGDLYTATDVLAHDGFFGRGKYTWKTAIKIAKQLAFMTCKLHEAEVIIGDFNPQNFLLGKDALVSGVDVDSYTISSHHKTLVAYPKLVAPELQGMPWSSERDSCQFTEKSDDFSLAILVFQLLTGVEPFDAVVIEPGESVSSSSVVLNIRHGNCPYVRHGISKRKADAPDVFGLLLPSYMRMLFDRCFDYTEDTATKPETIGRRPTAAEWYRALDRLERERGLRRCSSDPSHYYIPRAGTRSLSCCPWCERDAHMREVEVAMRHGSSSPGIASATTPPPAAALKKSTAINSVSARVPIKKQAYGLTSAAAEFLKSALKVASCLAAAYIAIMLLVYCWPVILILLVVGAFA